ncbi:hypothetical protein F5Y13DRAFT_205720 [Hypoxylon sp. FL1857]|nr:hypothetical protein F5Y13DRAFT_205720 [Hypoxylon sp. FL1857]
MACLGKTIWLYAGPTENLIGSRGLMAITTHHNDKPRASGEPLVWSNRRAALNDAVPYYRAHQGSLYTMKNVPQGMLIDAEVGSRDHFGSQVIITRAKSYTPGDSIGLSPTSHNILAIDCMALFLDKTILFFVIRLRGGLLYIRSSSGACLRHKDPFFRHQTGCTTVASSGQDAATIS